jgi:hypothetical protein
MYLKIQGLSKSRAKIEQVERIKKNSFIFRITASLLGVIQSRDLPYKTSIKGK